MATRQRETRYPLSNDKGPNEKGYQMSTIKTNEHPFSVSLKTGKGFAPVGMTEAVLAKAQNYASIGDLAGTAIKIAAGFTFLRSYQAQQDLISRDVLKRDEAKSKKLLGTEVIGKFGSAFVKTSDLRDGLFRWLQAGAPSKTGGESSITPFILFEGASEGCATNIVAGVQLDKLGGKGGVQNFYQIRKAWTEEAGNEYRAAQGRKAKSEKEKATTQAKAMVKGVQPETAVHTLGIILGEFQGMVEGMLHNRSMVEVMEIAKLLAAHSEQVAAMADILNAEATTLDDVKPADAEPEPLANDKGEGETEAESTSLAA